MTDNQIVKLVETESGLRAVFNLDDVQLDTRILGTWDKPVFFGKDIAEFLGFSSTKNALQKHVKPKYKTTLAKLMEKKVDTQSRSTFFSETLSYNDGKQVMIYEPGLYSLAMHSRLPRAEIFQDKIYEVILPELRKFGQVSLQKELSESMALLSIKEEEGVQTRYMLKRREEELEVEQRARALAEQEYETEKQEREKAQKQQRVAEFRTLTLNKLCVNYHERTRTQIFYIATSKAMSRDNEFKIGGVDNHSLLKKRLSMYNSGNSGVHPDLTMFFVFFIEISNYRQMENRMKELLLPFKSKQHHNTENFNLHFNILKPLTEIVSEHYNEEIERLNTLLKRLLETHTDQYVEAVELEPIDPDLIPDDLNVEVTVTRRAFGTSETQKVKISELNDNELKQVLDQILSSKWGDADHGSTIRRTDLERILEATFVISSQKRRIWEMVKPLIEDSGKVPKY